MIPEVVRWSSEAQLKGELAEDFTTQWKSALVRILNDAIARIETISESDIEELACLLVSTDAEVVLLAVEVCNAYRQCTGRVLGNVLKQRLQKLSIGWHGKKEPLDLRVIVGITGHEDLAEAERCQRLASSIYFEFHGQDRKLQVIQVGMGELQTTDCLLLFNRLVQEFQVPLELRFALLTRVRFAKAFQDATARCQYAKIMMLSMVDSTHSVERTRVQLRALATTESVPESLRTAALYAWTTIDHDKEQQLISTEERDARIHAFLSGTTQYSIDYMNALLCHSSAPLQLQDQDRQHRHKLPLTSQVFKLLSLNEALRWLEDELVNETPCDSHNLIQKQRIVTGLLRSRTLEEFEDETSALDRLNQCLLKVIGDLNLLEASLQDGNFQFSVNGWKVVDACIYLYPIAVDQLSAKMISLIMFQCDAASIPDSTLLQALSYDGFIFQAGGYHFLRQLPVSVVDKLEPRSIGLANETYASIARGLSEDFGAEESSQEHCEKMARILSWIGIDAQFLQLLVVRGTVDKLLEAFVRWVPPPAVYFLVLDKILLQESAAIRKADERRIKYHIYHKVLYALQHTTTIAPEVAEPAMRILFSLCSPILKSDADETVDMGAMTSVMSMGFSRKAAGMALKKAGNSIEGAVQILCQMQEDTSDDGLEIIPPPFLEMVDIFLKLASSCSGCSDLFRDLSLLFWERSEKREMEYSVLASLVHHLRLPTAAAAAKLLEILFVADGDTARVARLNDVTSTILELLSSPGSEAQSLYLLPVLKQLFQSDQPDGNPFATSDLSEAKYKEALVWLGNFVRMANPSDTDGRTLLQLGEILVRNHKLVSHEHVGDLTSLLQSLQRLCVNSEDSRSFVNVVFNLLEDHGMIYRDMVQKIRVFMGIRSRQRALFIDDFFDGEMSALAFRQPTIFLQACFDTCSVFSSEESIYIFLREAAPDQDDAFEPVPSSYFQQVFPLVHEVATARLQDCGMELLTEICTKFPSLMELVLRHQFLDRVLGNDHLDTIGVGKFLIAVAKHKKDLVVEALVRAFSTLNCSKLTHVCKVSTGCCNLIDGSVIDSIGNTLRMVNLDDPDAAAAVTGLVDIESRFWLEKPVPLHSEESGIIHLVSREGSREFYVRQQVMAQTAVVAAPLEAPKDQTDIPLEAMALDTENTEFFATLDPELRREIINTSPFFAAQRQQQGGSSAMPQEENSQDEEMNEVDHQADQEVGLPQGPWGAIGHGEQELETEELAADEHDDGFGVDNEMAEEHEHDDEMPDHDTGVEEDDIVQDQQQQEQHVSVLGSKFLETHVRLLWLAPEKYNVKVLADLFVKRGDHNQVMRILVDMLLRPRGSRVFLSPENGMWYSYPADDECPDFVVERAIEIIQALIDHHSLLPMMTYVAKDDITSFVTLVLGLLELDMKSFAMLNVLKHMLELDFLGQTSINIPEGSVSRLCALYTISDSVGDILARLVDMKPDLSSTIMSSIISKSREIVQAVLGKLEADDRSSDMLLLRYVRTFGRVVAKDNVAAIEQLRQALDSLWIYVRHDGSSRELNQAMFLAQSFNSEPTDSVITLAVDFMRSDPSHIESVLPLLEKWPDLFDVSLAHKLNHLRRKFGVNGTLLLNINRADILRSSLEEFANVSSQRLRDSRLHVRFQGEPGQDNGGLTREWFQVLSQTLVAEELQLFSAVGDCYQPNTQSGTQCSNHLAYFKFVGRLVAKAILEGNKLDISFTSSFCKQILGREVSYVDMDDPEFSRNLTWLLENNVNESMGLTFSVDVNVKPGLNNETVELVHGGRDISVTEANKHDYVRLLAKYHLTDSIKLQISAFVDGFYQIIPKDTIRIFTSRELEYLISGNPDISVDELESAFIGRHHLHILRWFAEVIKNFGKDDIHRLLKFTTGSSRLSGKNLIVGMSQAGANSLPDAHTCSNQIDLPTYTSKEQLEHKLLLAIREGCEGFAFG